MVLASMAVLFLVAGCGGTCGGAAAEPIDGYWQWEGDGVQQVRSTGAGSFEGVIVKVASIGQCAAPKGRVVLKLVGGGTHYTGQDEWYRDGDCARRFSNDAVIDLSHGNQTAHLCSSGPFTDVAPVHNCLDLKRIASYKPGA
jgi:hypothetical protein